MARPVTRVPSHFTIVAALPCEIFMSKNLQTSETDFVINNKSQGS